MVRFKEASPKCYVIRGKKEKSLLEELRSIHCGGGIELKGGWCLTGEEDRRGCAGMLLCCRGTSREAEGKARRWIVLMKKTPEAENGVAVHITGPNMFC